MPIYEFLCNKCKTLFEELQLSSSSFSSIACPKCKSSKVEKQLSCFSSTVATSSPASCSSFAPSCGAATGACGSGFCGNS